MNAFSAIRFFIVLGIALFSLGLVIGLRFLFYYFGGDGEGHIQSLILASLFLSAGFQVILVAFLSDLLSVNRRLLEDVQYRLKKIEYEAGPFDEEKYEASK